jgi:hypothetical protein
MRVSFPRRQREMDALLCPVCPRLQRFVVIDVREASMRRSGAGRTRRGRMLTSVWRPDGGRCHARWCPGGAATPSSGALQGPCRGGARMSGPRGCSAPRGPLPPPGCSSASARGTAMQAMATTTAAAQACGVAGRRGVRTQRVAGVRQYVLSRLSLPYKSRHLCAPAGTPLCAPLRTGQLRLIRGPSSAQWTRGTIDTTQAF